MLGMITGSMKWMYFIVIFFGIDLTLVFIFRWYNTIAMKKISAEYESVIKAVADKEVSND